MKKIAFIISLITASLLFNATDDRRGCVWVSGYWKNVPEDSIWIEGRWGRR